MKQVEEQARENMRATSSKTVIVSPWTGQMSAKRAALKRRRESFTEMQGRLANGVLQDGNERSGR
jgi:hypothetical protein